MSAEVIELDARRKPEDRNACETRLFMAALGLIFTDALAPIGSSDTDHPSEMIPFGGEGIDGIPTD